MKPRNRISDAGWTAFTEAIRFIVIPLVLVDLVTRYYPQLETAFMQDITLYVVFFGGMITASSALEVRNKPGSYKRLLFGLSTLAFVCMWIIVILGGGIATFSFGPYYVRFDISKIVYIMLFAVSLKALLVCSTFTSFRTTFEKELRQAKAASKADPDPRDLPQLLGHRSARRRSQRAREDRRTSLAGRRELPRRAARPL